MTISMTKFYDPKLLSW